MRKLGIITAAIANRNVLVFDYEGYQRRVEPHHYGILGNERQLHAYQFGGESSQPNLPEWRNFKFSHITHLHVEKEKYFKPRSHHNPENAHYKKIECSIGAL